MDPVIDAVVKGFSLLVVDRPILATGMLIAILGLWLWIKLLPFGQDGKPLPKFLHPVVIRLTPAAGILLMLLQPLFASPTPRPAPEIGGVIQQVPPAVVIRADDPHDTSEFWSSYRWTGGERFNVKWRVSGEAAKAIITGNAMGIELTKYANNNKYVFSGIITDYIKRASIDQKKRFEEEKAVLRLIDGSDDEKTPYFELIDAQAQRGEPEVVARLSSVSGARHHAYFSSGFEGRLNAWGLKAPTLVASAAAQISPNKNFGAKINKIETQLRADNARSRQLSSVEMQALLAKNDGQLVAWMNSVLQSKNPEDVEIQISTLYSIRSIVDAEREKIGKFELFDNWIPAISSITDATLNQLATESLVLPRDGSIVGIEARRFLRAIRDQRIPDIFARLIASADEPIRSCRATVEQNIYYNWMVSLTEYLEEGGKPLPESEHSKVTADLLRLLDKSNTHIKDERYQVQGNIAQFGKGYVFAKSAALMDKGGSDALRLASRERSIGEARTAFTAFVASSRDSQFMSKYRYPWHVELAENVLKRLKDGAALDASAFDLPRRLMTTHPDFSCKTA